MEYMSHRDESGPKRTASCSCSGARRIAHGHVQAGVTLDFLQGEDVAAVLNEVAGESVSQGVSGLAFRQVDGRPGSAQVATTN